MKKTLYRGTSEKIAATTGEVGVMVINTDTNRPHVFDGTTAGGHAVALLSDVPTDLAEQIIAICDEITTENSSDSSAS